MKKDDIKNELNYVQSLIDELSNDNLNNYNTGQKKHLKQIAFHKCMSKNRWVFGGNRSGKTECGAVEAIWFARGIHPYRTINTSTIGWVVSVSTQVQRDVAQNKILHYLNKDWIEDIIMVSGKKSSMAMGVIDTIVIRNVFGGLSKIGFKSCDQGREKFQGTSLDYVWFDEEPPYDIYLECLMRVLDKSGNIWGTMTPLKGLSWVYRTIYLNEQNNSEIWHEHMEWNDNPFLDVKEIEMLSSTLSKEELDARRYGLFGGSGGLVYSEFDENIHVIEPFDVPSDWYDNISIDPGLKNPLSAHFYAVDYDGNIYVIAEHFASNKPVSYHANCIKSMAQKLGWPKYNNKYFSLIDSAATQQTLNGQKSVVELFGEYGILTNPKVNKDMFSGINRVKSYLKNSLGETKLFIFKTCTNLIREFKSYFWGSNDRPEKVDDHCLDELRYYIMSKPQNIQPTKPKNDLQKDIERKIKRLKDQRKQFYG